MSRDVGRHMRLRQASVFLKLVNVYMSWKENFCDTLTCTEQINKLVNLSNLSFYFAWYIINLQYTCISQWGEGWKLNFVIW